MKFQEGPTRLKLARVAQFKIEVQVPQAHVTRNDERWDRQTRMRQEVMGLSEYVVTLKAFIDGNEVEDSNLNLSRPQMMISDHRYDILR